MLASYWKRRSPAALTVRRTLSSGPSVKLSVPTLGCVSVTAVRRLRSRRSANANPSRRARRSGSRGWHTPCAASSQMTSRLENNDASRMWQDKLTPFLFSVIEAFPSQRAKVGPRDDGIPLRIVRSGQHSAFSVESRTRARELGARSSSIGTSDFNCKCNHDIGKRISRRKAVAGHVEQFLSFNSQCLCVHSYCISD